MYKKSQNQSENFQQAYQNYKTNNLNEAKNFCMQILQENPNHFETIFLLGSIFAKTKNLIEAKKFLTKAIELRPSFIFAYNNLASVLNELGEIKNAIFYYKKAIEIKPDYLIALNNLCSLLRTLKITKLNNIENKIFKELFLLLFKRNDVDHNDLFSNAKSFLFENQNNKELDNLFLSTIPLLQNKNIQKFLKEELLFLMLQKSIVTDYIIEKILTIVRHEILLIFIDSDKNLIRNYYNFIVSLSEQCFLNEYIFSISTREDKYVKKLLLYMEKSKKIDEVGLAILGCYMPLNVSNILKKKLLKYKTKNKLFSNLISLQIAEPLREKKLVKSLKSFSKINDKISKKVRKQYEENPYPRWRYTYSNLPSNFIEVLSHQLKPNIVQTNFKFEKPTLLIAGCGTGSHIFVTKEYLNSKIFAIDLSLTSLAYAKRKIIEAGIKDVEFLHADILELKNFNRKFDIIESIGTLHHMKNPEKGLTILTNLLKPHGFLKLGLYSTIAREHITQTKMQVKKNKYKSNVNDIKKFREMIKEKANNNFFSKILERNDFYSTSSVKDLIFHEQEHTFTIPQISKMLKNLNLEFLGFSNSLIKAKYKEFYNSDIKNLNLENWHNFEKENPDTFIGMYKFWVRKKFN
tara:strand:- start:408 stop:2306 length:1899 start_codon:yes stop_codon:yes gene_type:complete